MVTSIPPYACSVQTTFAQGLVWTIANIASASIQTWSKVKLDVAPPWSDHVWRCVGPRNASQWIQRTRIETTWGSRTVIPRKCSRSRKSNLDDNITAADASPNLTTTFRTNQMGVMPWRTNIWKMLWAGDIGIQLLTKNFPRRHPSFLFSLSPQTLTAEGTTTREIAVWRRSCRREAHGQKTPKTPRPLSMERTTNQQIYGQNW